MAKKSPEQEYDEIIATYGDRYKELYGKISHIPDIVNLTETGKRMQELRLMNANLIKYVCRHSRMYKADDYINHSWHEQFITKDCHCRRNYNCEECTPAKDAKEEKKHQGRLVAYASASQKAVGRCHWGDDSGAQQKISDMESRGERIDLTDILTYAYMAKVPLSEIIQLVDGYYFDENGIIRRTGNPEYILLEEEQTDSK